MRVNAKRRRGGGGGSCMSIGRKHIASRHNISGQDVKIYAG